MLNQDGNGTALWIDTEATSGGHGIYFDAPALTTGNAIAIADWAAVTTGAALKVQLNGTALATTAASGVIDVSSTGDTDSNVNNLLYLNNDHADSSGTKCLFINQDSNNYAFEIDSEHQSSVGMVIDCSA